MHEKSKRISSQQILFVIFRRISEHLSPSSLKLSVTIDCSGFREFKASYSQLTVAAVWQVSFKSLRSGWFKRWICLPSSYTAIIWCLDLVVCSRCGPQEPGVKPCGSWMSALTAESGQHWGDSSSLPEPQCWSVQYIPWSVPPNLHLKKISAVSDVSSLNETKPSPCPAWCLVILFIHMNRFYPLPHLPCWQHPGQRGFLTHSQGSVPELWTWRSSSVDSAQSFHLDRWEDKETGGMSIYIFPDVSINI